MRSCVLVRMRFDHQVLQFCEILNSLNIANFNYLTSPLISAGYVSAGALPRVNGVLLGCSPVAQGLNFCIFLRLTTASLC